MLSLVLPQMLSRYAAAGTASAGWKYDSHSDMQEIISEEIVDETDLYESNRVKRHAKRQSTAVIMRGWVDDSSSYFIPRSRLPGFFTSSSIVERHRQRAETSSPLGEHSPLLARTLLDRPQSPLSITGGSTANYGALTSGSPRK